MGKNLVYMKDTTIRILYVDDEPALLELGKIFLERTGNFSVTITEGAPEAVTLLGREESFDAIISDYEMPDMNGLEFLQEIRKNGNTIPFIIFTGRGRESVVIEALNSGADFYLQKGGDPKSQFTELAEKVRYAVARRRSEAALRESEERYRNVVEDQTEFICRFDPDGRICFVNDAYLRHFGFEKEEIIGKKFRPSIHPADKEKVAGFFSSLTPEHPSGSVTQRVIMPDGRVIWQNWRTRAIFDSVGTLREFQSVGKDITVQKEAERELQIKNMELAAADEELRSQINELSNAQEALKESEARVRKKLDAILSPDGDIGLLNLSEIVDIPLLQALMNEYYTQVGLSLAIIESDGTVLVRSGWQEICTRFHRVHPQSCVNCVESDAYLSSGVKPGDYKIYQCKNNLWDVATPIIVSGHHLGNIFVGQFLFDDGPVDYEFFRRQTTSFGFDQDAYLTALSRAPRCSREKIASIMRFLTRLAGFIADISLNNLNLARLVVEHESSLSSLEISKEEYRYLAENAPVGILTCDTEGWITYLNQRVIDLLNSPGKEETLKINLLSFPPLVDIGFSGILQQVLDTGDSLPPVEMNYTSKWGKTLYFKAYFTPLLHQGELRGALIIVDDITREKMVEEALIQSNQKLRLLTSLTRHDIVNLLSAVQGYLDLAHETAVSDTSQSYISMAREQGDRIRETIGFTLVYEDFGYAVLGWQNVHELIVQASKEVTTGSVTINNEVPLSLSIYADPIIRKVFSTLMENSIRHGKTVSEIRFSPRELNGNLVLICEDNGVGIPKEEKEQIFEHGFGNHTGIGLFLAREILAITGLKICETGEAGRGARFEIQVPEGRWRQGWIDGPSG